MTNTASQILEAASDCIAERGRERDTPDGERSMRRCVEAFNALYGYALTEADGWAFMGVLKRARGRDADSLLDLVAYAALEAEAVARLVEPPDMRPCAECPHPALCVDTGCQVRRGPEDKA